MTLLLDTHVLLWSIEQPKRLSAAADAVISDLSESVLISAATIWEVAIKVGLKKLSLSNPFVDWMRQAVWDLDATILPITIEFADAQAKLPHHHGDPFDRMLAAQALVERIPIVSHDSAFDAYGVIRIW